MEVWWSLASPVLVWTYFQSRSSCSHHRKNHISSSTSSTIYANASLPLYSEAKFSSSSMKQEFMRTMATPNPALL
jgi:hypothetical protein